MVTKKVQTMYLSPFSSKYIKYFEDCKHNQVNCLEGAIRSGKTIINIAAFVDYIDNCKYGELFVVSGKTAGLAYTTVAECKGVSSTDSLYNSTDGYGLLAWFKGRCEPKEYGKLKALRVKTKQNKYVYIIFIGAYNKNAKESLRGLTIQGWLATELYNHRVEDDDDFINFMFGRLMLSPNYKVFWDLNPTYPTHGVYKKYIDPYCELEKEGNFSGGFNFVLCNLMDNSTLTEDMKNAILSRYLDKESVSYKRDILGIRACSNGLIFSNFAKDKTPWVLSNLTDFKNTHNIDFISIGVDFGGTGSNTTFAASAIYNNKRGVCIIASDKIDMSSGNSDVKEFKDRFKEFLMYVRALNVGTVRFVFGDSAETVMINEMRNVIRELQLANIITIHGSVKATIKQRIDAKKIMLLYKAWFVYEKATTVIESTETQIWDSREGHADERLDNGTTDVDTADAEEYSWSRWLDELVHNCSK